MGHQGNSLIITLTRSFKQIGLYSDRGRNKMNCPQVFGSCDMNIGLGQ